MTAPCDITLSARFGRLQTHGGLQRYYQQQPLLVHISARPPSPVRIWACNTSGRATALAIPPRLIPGCSYSSSMECKNLTSATAPPCVCESPQRCSDGGLPCQEVNSAAAGRFHCCTASPTQGGPRSHSPPSLLDVCLLLSCPPGSSTHSQGPPGLQRLRGSESCPQTLHHCKKIKQILFNDPSSMIHHHWS